MSPDPTLPPTIDENARRRFEAAWRAGKPEAAIGVSSFAHAARRQAERPALE